MAEYSLYHNPMSRGQIARWALHEAGADYDTMLIDWLAKPQAFLAANPMGKVPTLVHHHDGHDHVVTEAAAICHYLAEMSAPDLLPQSQEKADYFRWLFFAAGPLEQAVLTRAMGWEVAPEREGMAGFGTFDRAISAIEGWLTENAYVCGNRFTMADVYVGSQIDWGLQFGSIPTRPSFAAYAARLRERDAYRSAKSIDGELIARAQAKESR